MLAVGIFAQVLMCSYDSLSEMEKVWVKNKQNMFTAFYREKSP